MFSSPFAPPALGVQPAVLAAKTNLSVGKIKVCLVIVVTKRLEIRRFGFQVWLHERQEQQKRVIKRQRASRMEPSFAMAAQEREINFSVSR